MLTEDIVSQSTCYIKPTKVKKSCKQLDKLWLLHRQCHYCSIISHPLTQCVRTQVWNDQNSCRNAHRQVLRLPLLLCRSVSGPRTHSSHEIRMFCLQSVEWQHFEKEISAFQLTLTCAVLPMHWYNHTQEEGCNTIHKLQSEPII